MAFGWGLRAGMALFALAAAAGAEERRVPDSEVFRLEDRYQTGNYLVMGGVLAAVTAQLTHDQELALGFLAGSIAMRHAGLPLMGESAEGLCRAHGVDSYCANNAYFFYGLSVAAEAVVLYEVYELLREDWDGLPLDDTRVAIAGGAAAAALAAYGYAWYRFYEVRHRNVPEEGRMAWSPWVTPRGAVGLALSIRFRD